MYKIIKITQNSYDALALDNYVKIHSVFKNLINVETNKGIFTIQNELIGLSPLSAIVRGNQPFSKSLFLPGSLLHISQVDSHIVLDNPYVISPYLKRSHQLDTFTFPVDIIYKIIEKELKTHIVKSEITMGFSDLITSYKGFSCLVDKNNQYSSPLHIMIIQIFNEFVKDFYSDKEENFNCFIRLIGLGNGLTPSGDDFLVGLISIFHFFKYHIQEEKLRKIIFCNMDKTSLLSKSFLRESIQGNFSELIINLYDCIDKKNYTSLKEVTQLILEYGHSSGVDIISGILFGLYYIQSSQKKSNSIIL